MPRRAAGWTALTAAIGLIAVVALVLSAGAGTGAAEGQPPVEIVGVNQEIDRQGEVHVATDDAT